MASNKKAAPVKGRQKKGESKKELGKANITSPQPAAVFGV